MPMFSKPTTLVAVVGAILVASACNPQGETGQIVVENDTATMVFNAPDQLLSARNVVLDNLILRITIGNTVNEVTPDADGNYILQTQLPENTRTVVSLCPGTNKLTTEYCDWQQPQEIC